MKISLALLFFVTSSLIYNAALFSQPPDTLWTKTYGGVSFDEGKEVRQTSDNGYIIAGHTYSFGPAQANVYLVKTNQNGNEVWSKAYGGASHDRGFSVCKTSDGGYIVTGFTYSFGGQSNVYLIKTNTSGDTSWTKTYGGLQQDEGHSVIQTNDGGYAIAGHTYSYGAGQSDIYFIKTNASGDTSWTKTYGGSLAEYSHLVKQTPDGGYIIVGSTKSYGSGNTDVYIIKTDSNGNLDWSKTYGGGADDEGYSIYRCTDTGFIITGYTYSFGGGQSNVYLIKTNASGDTSWTKTFGGVQQDEGRSVIQTNDGGYAITGFTYSYGSGQSNVYLIKADQNGNELWSSTYGGTNADEGNSVIQTNDNGYAILGYTYSYGTGQSDAYLIKTEPDVSIREKEIPKRNAIKIKAAPNPFSEFINIYYSLPNYQELKIEIFSIAGQFIKKLVENGGGNCTHRTTWNGCNNEGIKQPAGIYFIRATAGTHKKIMKISKLR
jgi:hypothetical protein